MVVNQVIFGPWKVAVKSDAVDNMDVKPRCKFKANLSEFSFIQCVPDKCMQGSSHSKPEIRQIDTGCLTNL